MIYEFLYLRFSIVTRFFNLTVKMIVSPHRVNLPVNVMQNILENGFFRTSKCEYMSLNTGIEFPIC